MSELALQLINECYETKNPKLDLGNCGLRDKDFANGRPIDLALRTCPHLETLVLSNEWWNYDTYETVDSINTGTPNHLTIIPPAVTSLVELITFVCCGNYDNLWGITDLTPLSGLTYLRFINISCNKISAMQGLGTLTGLQQLYLSYNQLSEIKGLDDLTALQQLDLSGNQLSEIKGLDYLTVLQQLYLANNQLSEIKGLNNLTALQQLDLANNQLSEIKGLDNLTALQQLDLSGNQLSEIKGLDYLTVLQQLYLANNQLSEIKGLDNLTALQQLDLANNQLSEIKGLNNLTALHQVDLSGNQLSKIKGLDYLTALHQLDLSGNQLSEIKGLDYLTALQQLDLSYNKLSEIKGLDNSTALQQLDLTSNQLSEIKGLDYLTALQKLYLANNQLSEIKGLDYLTALQKLYLASNQLSEIKGVDNLTDLQQLYLHINQITEIKGLDNLTNLQLIDLSHNRITDLKGMNNLTALQQLDLSHNRISEIKGLNNTHSLTSILIQSNQIKDLSGILSLDNLREVIIHNNPVEKDIPPEVLAAGWQAIRDRLLASGQPVAFKEVKILLLGNTNVGKSNLLEYLETNKVPTIQETTHGIRYTCLSNLIEGARLHCWDFGGQEYFHATHQLFFSPGALHIVLWSKEDIQRDKNNPEACFDLHYWLRCIEQLIPREVQQPVEVMVVENKIDLTEFRATPLNQHLYQNKHHHFNFNFTSISLTQLKRLHDFKEVLEERVEKLYTTHSPVYKRYLEAIQHSSKDILSLSEIDPDTEKVQTAMKVFHNMGILLYFHAIIPNTIFIRPQALLDFLYNKILGHAMEEAITEKQINEAIKENRWKLTLQQVISLLQHFDLIFQIPERTGIYYIPQYLKDAPLLVDFFERHYFREANIRIESDHYLMNLAMLKIFAAYGGYVKRKGINERLFWKDGIIIEKNDALLMVKFNRHNQSIELFPDINHKNFDLQKEVVRFILSFSSRQSMKQESMEKVSQYAKDYLRAKKKADIDQPVIEERKEDTDDINWKNDNFSVHISLDGKFFAEWNKLNDNVISGIFQVESISKIYNEAEQKTEIKKKIESVFDYNKYLLKKNKGQMKKLFISYSKDDLPLINKFLEHLSALQLDGKIAHWYCTELTAGTDWHHEIQEHFDQSDIVCFMVSPNFMRTKYIHEHEIKKAFERQAKDPKFKIVPIILDFCKWTTNHNNLGQFTALPYTAKPVVDFSNQNMAWYIIQECLRLMIEKDLNPTGEDFYASQALPKDVLKLLERIVAGKADA